VRERRKTRLGRDASGEREGSGARVGQVWCVGPGWQGESFVRGVERACVLCVCGQGRGRKWGEVAVSGWVGIGAMVMWRALIGWGEVAGGVGRLGLGRKGFRWTVWFCTGGGQLGRISPVRLPPKNN
jgi:hypothetical protein